MMMGPYWGRSFPYTKSTLCVCVCGHTVMTWQLCTFLEAGGEDPQKGWKQRWFKADLYWWMEGMKERRWKVAFLFLYVQVNLCCLYNASSQILSWQHITSKHSVEKMPLWNLCPVVQGPLLLLASHAAKNQCSACYRQLVVSSCHFLRPHCSSGVQITFWAVQLISRPEISKIW